MIGETKSVVSKRFYYAIAPNTISVGEIVVNVVVLQVKDNCHTEVIRKDIIKILRLDKPPK